MTVANRQYHFNVFRYQILPITQDFEEFQTRFSPNINSLKELKEKKNEFFLDAIDQLNNFKHTRAELIHKIVLNKNDIIVILLGVNRSIMRNTRDFTKEQLEDWPNIWIAFNNNPDVQKILVQIDHRVFFRTSTVAHIIEASLNQQLSVYNLHCRINPTFETNQFWDVVSQHTGRIVETEFFMISPNLANISKGLKLDLRQLHENTNTQETTIKLQSDKASNLTLKKSDDFISSLVDYSSLGGGNISIKIKGVRKKIRTQDRVSEISFDSVELDNLKHKELLEIFKKLMP